MAAGEAAAMELPLRMVTAAKQATGPPPTHHE